LIIIEIPEHTKEQTKECEARPSFLDACMTHGNILTDDEIRLSSALMDMPSLAVKSI
jgi:hypothetical protein